MTGQSYKISFDKSNQIFSYFLKAIEIVHSHGGRVRRRWDFVNDMAQFCQSSPTMPNGDENRAWYNKSLFPRYYGFLDLLHCSSKADDDIILSTPRGEQLLELMEVAPKALPSQHDSMYYIPTRNRLSAYNLFLDSLTFDTFGRNNTGAEKSHSDIDPPKVMMRVVGELGGATKEEVCYCIYALHRRTVSGIDEAISNVLSNRTRPGFSYASINRSWGLENISYDFKLAKLLADPGLSLFEIKRDPVSKNEIIAFATNVPQEVVRRLSSFDGVFHPMKWMVKTNSVVGFREWVRNVVAGSTHDDSMVYYGDLTSTSFADIKSTIFKDALIRAYSVPDRNVYFALLAHNEQQIVSELGLYCNLINRVDDICEDYNGWSVSSVSDAQLRLAIDMNCVSFRGPDGRRLNQILRTGEIKLPSNLFFIGGVQNA